MTLASLNPLSNPAFAEKAFNFVVGAIGLSGHFLPNRNYSAAGRLDQVISKNTA